MSTSKDDSATVAPPGRAAARPAGDGAKTSKAAKELNVMLAEDNTIHADGVRDYANRAGELIGDFLQRLDVEVGKPLTEMRGAVDDPNSGALMVGSHRLQAALDTARQHLRVAASAAVHLAQDIVD